MVTPLEFALDVERGAAVRELYAADPAGFVAARTSLQKVARAAGRRDDAAVIGRLRKPSVAEHALNRLARSAEADLLHHLRARHDDATAAQAAAITGDPQARAGLRAATAAARAAHVAAVEAALRVGGAPSGAAREARAGAIDEVLRSIALAGTRAGWDALLAGVVGADGGAGDEPDAESSLFRGIADGAAVPVVPDRERVVRARTPGRAEAASARLEAARAAYAAAEEARRVAAAAHAGALRELRAAERALEAAVGGRGPGRARRP